MSERGSFATEIVWCADCHRVIGDALRETLAEPDFTVREVVFCQGETQEFQRGLWCGIVTGLYAGEEIHVFEGYVNPLLTERLCHPLQVVVFAENGTTQVFSLLPVGWLAAHPSAEPIDVAPTPPPPALMFPITSLGDKLTITHIVEAFQPVTYQVPLYIDSTGRLVCDTSTIMIPSEVVEAANAALERVVPT